MKKTYFNLPGAILALALTASGLSAEAAGINVADASPTRTALRMPDLFGSSLYAYSLTDANSLAGFYNLSLFADMDLLWESQTKDAHLFNGWMSDGRLCGLNINSTEDTVLVLRYDEFDPETGEVLKSLDLGPERYSPYFRQCTYLPESNRIFGIGPDEKGWSCVKYLDMEDPFGEAVTLAGINYTKYVYGICYNAWDKNVYAVTESKKFVRIDQETGEYEDLLDLNLPGMRSSFAHGLAYIPESDEYIFAANTSEWNTVLYLIDLNTGITREIGYTPTAEAISFIVCTDEVDPAAPVRPEFLSQDFKGGNLSGTFSYRLPTELRDGTAATGTLSWTLRTADGELASGQGAPGDEIKANVTMQQGRQLLEMSVANGSHHGPALNTYVFVGNDTPKAPENVVLTEGKVTWDAVTEGVNGGYLNLDDLFYEVYINDRYIGETEGTELTFAITDDTPCGKHTAEVIAICSDIESDGGISNPALYGAPLQLDARFAPTVAEGELFTCISAGGDYVTWGYQESDESFATTSPWNGEAEARLVTPPLAFADNEKVYSVAFDAKTINSYGANPAFSVTLTRAYEDEEPVKTIVAEFTPQLDEYKNYSETFTVPEAGKYYISFNCRSARWANQLAMKNIAITVTDIPADAPTMCTDIIAKGAEQGKLSASVSFRMPVTDLVGREIPADAQITATLTCGEHTASATGLPGSEQTVEIGTEQGTNEIAILSSIGDITGQSTSVSVFTGIDRPGVPENFRITMDETNHIATCEWEHPSKGADGYYFEPTDMKYRLYYRFGWFSVDMGEVTDGSTKFEYTFPESDSMTQFNIYLVPSNATGEGPATSAVAVPGKPYTLPINETFYNSEQQYPPVYLDFPSDEYRSAMYWITYPYQVEEIFERYDHIAIEVFPSISDPSASRLYFPKFTTMREEGQKDEKTSIKATFEIWTGDMMASEITLLAQSRDMDEPIEIGKVQPGSGWSTVEFFLPSEFLDKDWMNLMLDSQYSTSPQYTAIYTYSIEFVSATGVDTFNAAESSIRAKGSYVYLSNLEGQSYTICTLDGKTVKAGNVDEPMLAIGLEAGVYVVRAGSMTSKIVVR